MDSDMPHTKPIDLLKGWPNPSLLPSASLLKASHGVLSDDQVSKLALQYAPDEGWQELRERISHWLTQFYQPKDAVSPERICITGGASQNLACLLQTYTDPIYTRAAFMVAPTYYLACRIFEDSGFAGRMKAVPEDEEGINMEYLSNKISQIEADALSEGNTTPKLKPPRPWRKIYKYVIYAVPTFANPSGRIMSLDRREKLVRLARKYDALIITDDVYDMLQWPVHRREEQVSFSQAYLPRIVDIDRYLDGGPQDEYGNAVSNGSFSKLIGPGCRTGWAEGTEKFAYGVSQTGSSRSGGCPSQLAAACIEQMMATDAFSDHIERDLKTAYARRFHTLLKAVESHLLPLGLTMPQPNKEIAGGYFIWLTLPQQLDAVDVSRRALEEEALSVIAGPRFQVVGDDAGSEMRFRHGLRLCFAWEEEELLEEGVQRLARVVKSALAE